MNKLLGPECFGYPRTAVAIYTNDSRYGMKLIANTGNISYFIPSNYIN